MYALADCNNFFVSCERVFRPDLRDKPVVVLSGNDGCVVARSNEVKALGIKMGVPFYQIQPEVKKYGIVHFSSNFSLYGDLSSRIMQILSRYTADLQQYSIDEAFLDLSHITDPNEAKLYCEHIRQELLQGIGIPVSFGIAPTKTLCKVASHYAKRYAGYKGVCLIDTEEKRVKALADYPIGDVWGIGRQANQKLNTAGVHTALDFSVRSALFARNLLNKPGWETWKELNGEDCITTRELPEKRTITCSRTFAHGITDRSQLEQALSEFCATTAAKLRKQHSVCRQMLVFAHTSRFRTEQTPAYINQIVSFATPTCNTIELTQHLLRVVRTYWQANQPYKRAGIILMQIEPQNGVQQNLFDERNREQDNRLQKAIDNINSQYGKHTIMLAPQLKEKDAEDLYNVGSKSPAYSTKIEDIITLHC